MHDTNLFIRLFKEYCHLSGEVERELNTKVQFLTKKKGSFIIKKGQIVSNLFIVEKGLIRSFYNKEEQEITVWFGYENIPFAAIASIYSNQASHETIQCLEDSVFQYISEKDLYDLYEKYPEVNTIGRKIAEEYCILLDERAFSFQTKSAEERYDALIKNEPEIIKRAPLGYIASYLGITQETLSRIRRKK
ncbi:MAG: Crp/Fnr family transcriptional regulator [Prevotella sp.]|jgi:CRP-like cAMP-binding protein|nr:Crp/Fnr family transcriptional regulator [Prevotella sp.]